VCRQAEPDKIIHVAKTGKTVIFGEVYVDCQIIKQSDGHKYQDGVFFRKGLMAGRAVLGCWQHTT
jgi:hypothetical protein